MNDVLTMPEAIPASSGATSFIADSSTGLKAMPAPIPSRSMLGSTSTTKSPSTGARANSSSPTAAVSKPAISGGRTPKRITSRAETPTERTPMITLAGRNDEPDLERAVAEHELQVQRGEEEPREHRGRPEHADGVGGRGVALTEQTQRHERRLDPRLDRQEQRQQQDGAAEAAERLAQTSSPRRCRGRSRTRPASAHAVTVIAPPMSSWRTARSLRPSGSSRSDSTATSDADGHVHEEDPVPAEDVGEDRRRAARRSSRRRKRRSRRCPSPSRARPARGTGSSSATATSPTRSRRRCPASRGSRPASSSEFDSPQPSDATVNDTIPIEEQAPMPVEVAKPSAEHQAAAEGQQVRVDDPRQRAVGESEVLLDRRQRDVHDRLVEDDHQRAEAQHRQRDPSRGCWGGRGAGCGAHAHRR